MAVQPATSSLFFGNLDGRVDRELLYECGLQAGSVIDVRLPPGPGGGEHRGFGFVDYETAEAAEYALRMLSGLELYGRPVIIRFSPGGRPKEPNHQPPPPPPPLHPTPPPPPAPYHAAHYGYYW